jgi:hypothetical protein
LAGNEVSFVDLHPAFGILAIALMLIAYSLKAGPHKFWQLHYYTGVAAGLAGVAAFVAALLAIGQQSADPNGPPGLPGSALIHFMLSLMLMLSLVTQVVLGLLMRVVIGGPPRFLPYHRINSRILLVLAIATFLFGFITLQVMNLD